MAFEENFLRITVAVSFQKIRVQKREFSYTFFQSPSRHTTSFQRLQDVYTTSAMSYRRLIDVETTSCVYWAITYNDVAVTKQIYFSPTFLRS